MGIEIKTFNYMEMASQIVYGPRWPKSHERDLTPTEYVDLRLAELQMLAASPSHQILAVFMEQEIAEHLKYVLGKRDPLEPMLYALRSCNPFHSPIAKSLTKEKIQSFRDVSPGSEAYDLFDENQKHYANQMIDGARSKINVTPNSVTLNTGFEGIDHAIRTYSFSIAQYFYVLHVAKECFPAEVDRSIRHAAGVEQVKNSAISKTIRKTIAENVESGHYPEFVDANKILDSNLKMLSDWIKPRDTQLAAAYVKGKRDVAWIEQYAPADLVLTKMTENLAEKGFHQKWGGSLPTMILDLCDHLKLTHEQLVTTAIYDLAAAMASDKVLGSEGAKESLDRIALMAKSMNPEDGSSKKGVLAMKLIGLKLGIEEGGEVAEFVHSNGLTKTMEPMMEKLYPNAIERARMFQALGIKSDSPAMLKAKGRALMDDLGM